MENNDQVHSKPPTAVRSTPNNMSTVPPSTALKIWGLLTTQERRTAILLLGLMFVAMALETLGIGLIIPALALLTQADSIYTNPDMQPYLKAVGYPSKQALVTGAMLVLITVYLVKTIFLGLLALLQTRFAFNVQVRLSQRMFTIYLRQPYTFHLQHNSATLMRNVSGEVGTFTGNGLRMGMILISESMVLLGLCGLLLTIEPIGALVVVGVLGAAAWSFNRFTRGYITEWGIARQYHDGLRTQHLQQGLGGAKDVKLLGRESEFLSLYLKHNSLGARAAQLQATLQQFPRLWLELLAVLGLAILVLTMLERGRALESVLPMLGVFAGAAFRLIPSVNRMLVAAQAVRFGLPGINTLYEELSRPTPEVNEQYKRVARLTTALTLAHVGYTYSGAAAPALRDISLSIGNGESIGFIGSSGAGKSTLVDILLGLLTPSTGQVMVDQENIQSNLRNWQDQIGYVPQSIYLTDDTLRRNVAFGLPDEQIDDVAVKRAIQAAQLDNFVAGLPKGLETVVGERGIRLSGGQRQRIGIARALYHDPAVLVLDEATSALDTDTERGVMDAVRALRNKTVLIVAHRLSTVAHCQKLYRLEQGEIVEVISPPVEK